MLSNQSKYAIRGVIYLALNASEKKKLGSKEVAQKIKVPQPFLAKILQTLSKEEIIKSSKGPKGGFFLTEKELSGNLMKVIECIDGLDAFKTCYIGLPHCSDENPCAIHHLGAPLRNQLITELKKRSIAEFAEDTKKGRSFIF
jgi:Rrf2 family iron-sulfur cluster assembly transcriptional regulator